jgi:hypothetical protein
VHQVGEVAAYTPQSIDKNAWNDQWLDTTSNANHGAVTGATAVNNPDHYGILTVKGRAELGNRDLNDSGTIKLGDTPLYQARISYDAGGATNLSIDNSYNSASAKTSFGMKTSSLSRLPVLELLGDGSVKATNFVSSAVGDLKQVARVHAGGITFNATTTHIAFRIVHNLNTWHPVITVNEDYSPYSVVETEIRLGNWIHPTTNDQGDATGTIGAVATSGTGSNHGKEITVIFSSHQGNATKFRVGITG